MHMKDYWASLKVKPTGWFSTKSNGTAGTDIGPLIQLTSGTSLPVTQEEYDAARSKQVRRQMDQAGFRTLCHAPFTTMDFAPGGYVSPCNHFGDSLAMIDTQFSILELWNGARMSDLREQMIEYTLDPDVCRHCVRQISARQCDQAFSVVQFDSRPAIERRPTYPKRMIFRMRNTCNLACIMCDGETSSRVRREFEKLPPVASLYGERFFEDLEEILPHLEHVEFYGGEPFLVHEHVRIFELIEKTGAPCSIYVNTNATVLNSRTRAFLEKLNFTVIAISMDAVSAEVHEQIRYGLRSKVFNETVAYFLDLRKRKDLFLVLNVTEHRKNWFELPEVFRFAERHELALHINTCIHPENVTLYTLPTDQLQYVLQFTLEERKRLCAEFAPFKNLPAYDFYISLMGGELDKRGAAWRPIPYVASPLSDGLLAAPLPGLAPFARPEQVAAEARRMQALDRATRHRMLQEMKTRIITKLDVAEWSEALACIDAQLAQSVRGGETCCMAAEACS